MRVPKLVARDTATSPGAVLAPDELAEHSEWVTDVAE
jgi:hypothetical protein